MNGQEGEVTDQVECPERASVAIEVGHEIDNHVVEEKAHGRERQIGEGVGESDCGRTEKAVASLFLENGTTLDLNGELSKSVETRDKHCDENDGSTCEGTGRSGLLVIVRGAEDDGEGNTESEAREQLELILLESQ